MHPAMRWIATPSLAVFAACTDADPVAANIAARADAGIQATSAQAATLKVAGDRSLLSLAGKVVATAPNTFQLDSPSRFFLHYRRAFVIYAGGWTRGRFS